MRKTIAEQGTANKANDIIVIVMAKLVTFQLDTEAAAVVVGQMAMPLIRQSASAVNARAQSMAGSISSNPPKFSTDTQIGTIKRGRRAIGTIKANFGDARQSYIAHTALKKAKDAGRIN